MKPARDLLLLASLLTACGGSSDQPEVADQAKAGFIPVTMYAGGSGEYSIAPSFISATPDELCTIETFEPCKRITCPSSRRGVIQSSAGPITVAVGSNSDTVKYDTHSYQSFEMTGMFFNGGETISVQGQGDAVPGFSGTITAPSPVSVTAPVDSQLAISQSQPLQVSWTGTSAGILLLQLKMTDASTNANVSVECHLPASAGSGTIPAAALAQIAQGTYEADIFTRTRNEISAGDWSVLLDAEYEAAAQGSGAYKRSATVGP